MCTSRSYVMMRISARSYAEIKARLLAAGYDDAVRDNSALVKTILAAAGYAVPDNSTVGEVLVMGGFGLVSADPGEL